MYSFYLGSLLLPVTPGKLTVTINNNNETVNLADHSQVNLLKLPGLTDFAFEALIPAWQKYPFARYNETENEQFLDWANDHGYRMDNADLFAQDPDAAFLSNTRNETPATPEFFLHYFEHLKTSRQSVQFIVLRDKPNGTLLWDLNKTVSLEEYEIVEDAEDNNDLTVSIKLKEYATYQMQTIEVKTNSQTGKTTATKTTTRTTTKSTTTANKKNYTVVNGDTLWGISKKFYSDGSKWQKIYDANKSTIEAEAKKHGKASSSNGHWIWAGEKLVIP